MEHYTERDKKNTFNEQAPNLHENDEKLKDPSNNVNAFNNFFITTAGKYNIYQVEKGDAISILTDTSYGKFPSIKIIPITEEEIKCTIQYLQKKH
jgi:hypothetical protein